MFLFFFVGVYVEKLYFLMTFSPVSLVRDAYVFTLKSFQFCFDLIKWMSAGKVSLWKMWTKLCKTSSGHAAPEHDNTISILNCTGHIWLEGEKDADHLISVSCRVVIKSTFIKSKSSSSHKGPSPSQVWVYTVQVRARWDQEPTLRQKNTIFMTTKLERFGYAQH